MIGVKNKELVGNLNIGYALSTLISLIASEKRIEDFAEGMRLGAMRSVFESAVEQVFGFRPGTPEAKQFWQQHGEPT